MIVVWRVTERCNLSCKFCAFDRELDRPRQDADPQVVRDFGRILTEYQRGTGDPVLVSWLGGEPLFWSPLTELSRTFSAEYHLRLSTTTNGTCLGAPSVRAHLLEHYSELTISVDAIGALHDRLRGWPAGYAYLERHVKALAHEKQASRRGPVLRANVLLMRETLPGFEQLALELAAWGFEEVTFNQLGGNDRPEFYANHRLLPEQADWLFTELPRLRTRLAAHGVRLCGSESYLKRFQATARGVQISIHDCYPGRTALFINEAGLAAPCSFTVSEYGVPVQTITSVDQLRRLPALFAEKRRHHQAAPCQDCHSTQVFEKFAA